MNGGSKCGLRHEAAYEKRRARRSILARDAKHLFRRRNPRRALAPAVVEDRWRAGARLPLEVGFRSAFMDQPAHRLVDTDELVDAGAALVARVASRQIGARPIQRR